MANDEGNPPPPPSSSLWRMDDPAWHGLPGYNGEVCVCLGACKAVLQRAGPPLRNYARIYGLLAPVRDARMCAPQRVRVMWLLALAYAGVDDHLQALQVLDLAAIGAADAHDEGALAELLDFHGSLNVATQHFAEAQLDFDDAATLYDQRRDADADADAEGAALEAARLLRQRADTLYLLARPEEAAATLMRARELLRRVRADDDSTLAEVGVAIEYTQAHLDRIMGSPDAALRPALRAASYFTKQGPKRANTAARTHLFAAEVALDIAERMESEHDRGPMLHMARAHLAEALRLAERSQRESGDDGGIALVQLGEQRLARLLDGARTAAAAREEVIRRVLRAAEERDDRLLLAQAHTALADELAARSHMSEALAHYKRAVEVVEQTEAPVLAVPARRALHTYHERHPGPLRLDPPEEDDVPAD